MFLTFLGFSHTYEKSPGQQMIDFVHNSLGYKDTVCVSKASKYAQNQNHNQSKVPPKSNKNPTVEPA